MQFLIAGVGVRTWFVVGSVECCDLSRQNDSKDWPTMVREESKNKKQNNNKKNWCH
jgi:hypothetical protein